MYKDAVQKLFMTFRLLRDLCSRNPSGAYDMVRGSIGCTCHRLRLPFTLGVEHLPMVSNRKLEG